MRKSEGGFYLYYSRDVVDVVAKLSLDVMSLVWLEEALNFQYLP